MTESLYVITYKSMLSSGKMLHSLSRLLTNNLMQFLSCLSPGQVFNRCRPRYTFRRGNIAY